MLKSIIEFYELTTPDLVFFGLLTAGIIAGLVVAAIGLVKVIKLYQEL